MRETEGMGTEMIERVISGGQTGADMGGLLAARDLGIATGGWVARGWMTEAGPNPDLATFSLVQCTHGGYPDRTQHNVEEADGTIIFGDMNSPGSRLTKRFCLATRKSHVHIRFAAITLETVPLVQGWVEAQQIRVLNVAGNRESKASGIEVAVQRFLTEVLRGP